MTIRYDESIEADIAHDRELEAREDRHIEQAIRRGELAECESCGQVIVADEPCPDCEAKR
ncbi:MAG: hypothetical protein ACRDJY_03195 [Thermoleophilaceae bacterium]